MKLIGYGDEDGFHLNINYRDYNFDLEGNYGRDTIINLSNDEYNVFMINGFIVDGELYVNNDSSHFKNILKKYGDIGAIDKIEAFIKDIEEEEEQERLDSIKYEKEREKANKMEYDRNMNKIKYGISNGGRPKIPDIVDTKYDGVFSYSKKGTGIDYRTLDKGNKFTEHMDGRYLRNSDIINLFIGDLGEDILIINKDD